MIKVEKIETWGFEHAIRGMRNSFNSHDKSDSGWGSNKRDSDIYNERIFNIGDNDLELMHKLYKAGAEHRKYMRSIFVSMDITAPLYFYKQFSTYKIGTTANSTSTMHRIHSRDLTFEDFSCEHLLGDSLELLQEVIEKINKYRTIYNETKEKKYWWQIIQLLPDSYNQLRTVTMNYENVVNIINQRRGHRLDEWNTFIDIMLNELPYLKEIMQ